MKIIKKYKLGRKLGAGVFEKCQTSKFVMSEARHAKNNKKKRPKVLSGYGVQFLEKQKVRFMYGLSEEQFSKYVKKTLARKSPKPTEYLFELLESRLDNIVYRLGLAHTRRLARQMVSHGHILVNEKRSTVPSHQIKIGDSVSIRVGSQKSPLFSDIVKKNKDYSVPNWLIFKPENLLGKVQGKPTNIEGFIDLNVVLEFYNR